MADLIQIQDLKKNFHVGTGRVLKAIREDLDLGDHMNDGVKSLKIVLAADRSIHEGQVVMLD